MFGHTSAPLANYRYFFARVGAGRLADLSVSAFGGARR